MFSLTDCSAIYNIRFSSTLPLSISEELFCHVFSLSSVESLSLKPFINHFPLLSWNALSYLKYARLVCRCMCVCTRRRTAFQMHSSKNIKGSKHTHTHTEAGHISNLVNKSLSTEREKTHGRGTHKGKGSRGTELKVRDEDWVLDTHTSIQEYVGFFCSNEVCVEGANFLLLNFICSASRHLYGSHFNLSLQENHRCD